jgi:hypothetical protein
MSYQGDASVNRLTVVPTERIDLALAARQVGARGVCEDRDASPAGALTPASARRQLRDGSQVVGAQSVPDAETGGHSLASSRRTSAWQGWSRGQ